MAPCRGSPTHTQQSTSEWLVGHVLANSVPAYNTLRSGRYKLCFGERIYCKGGRDEYHTVLRQNFTNVRIPLIHIQYSLRYPTVKWTIKTKTRNVCCIRRTAASRRGKDLTVSLSILNYSVLWYSEDISSSSLFDKAFGLFKSIINGLSMTQFCKNVSRASCFSFRLNRWRRKVRVR